MTTLGFILIDGFALLSFAAASEPFRAANTIAGRPLYRMRWFGEGAAATSSSGAAVPTEPLDAADGLAIAFVVAGGAPAGWDRPAVRGALRRLAAAGVTLGGISGGPFVLAAAGLLANRAFTVHWEHAAALAEAFPDFVPQRARTVIDRDRITCGGGVAPLDMAHALIARDHGAPFARAVSDWFLHTEVGAATAAQRASPAERWGVHHAGLLRVLAAVEERVATPLTRAEAARLAGVSERQLDRLFAGHLAGTFRDTARTVRLAEAERLLRQSALSVSEIAYATGFSSPAHLSRAFRAAYGRSPSEARALPSR